MNLNDVLNDEAKRASIMCRLCNTPFCWQQLTFVTD